MVRCWMKAMRSMVLIRFDAIWSRLLIRFDAFRCDLTCHFPCWSKMSLSLNKLALGWKYVMCLYISPHVWFVSEYLKHPLQKYCKTYSLLTPQTAKWWNCWSSIRGCSGWQFWFSSMDSFQSRLPMLDGPSLMMSLRRLSSKLYLILLSVSCHQKFYSIFLLLLSVPHTVTQI